MNEFVEVPNEKNETPVEEMETEKMQTQYHAIILGNDQTPEVITETRQRDLLKRLEAVPREHIFKVYKGRELELKVSVSYGF